MPLLRRITCQRWQPQHQFAQAQHLEAGAHSRFESLPRVLPLPLLAALLACASASRWFLLRLHCLTVMALLLATGLHVPLLATAAMSAAASSTGSDPAGSGASAGGTSAPPLKPHIVLLSLPWRGHMMPLITVGRRLVKRGFHVSMGVATAEAQEFVALQAGDEIETFPAGNFTACARVKRPRERQPLFHKPFHGGFNTTLHASLHPGAQLTDLFVGPPFAFEDVSALDAPLPSMSPSQPGAPNGVSLLMRTFIAFQQCMGATLMQQLRGALMEPATYAARRLADQAALQVEVPLPKGVSARERKARDAVRATRENSVPLIDVPQLFVVDRFALAALDAVRALDARYVVNNAQLLLDIDSPNWSLPTPWSYLPHAPPLTIPARVSNLLHRVNYRATMLRALALVNANRAQLALPPLSDWSDYHGSALVLTNTVWGVELHRSADALGMHAYRNANPAANGHTPRFRMTGPLLPQVERTNVTAMAVQAASAEFIALGGLPSFIVLDQKFWQQPSSLLPRDLALDIARWKLNTSLSNTYDRRIVYVNLGDGREITRADLTALFAGFRRFADQLRLVLSLPTARALQLQPVGGWPSFVIHVNAVRQYELLSFYAGLHMLAFVVTHASLSNIQEAIACRAPLLLLPHPTVDQHEVAARFVRSRAAIILQRVQLSKASVRDSIQRLLTEKSYTSSAQQLSLLLQPLGSQASTAYGTNGVVAQLELVYRTGAQHLLPLSQYTVDEPGGTVHPLPFYQHDPLFGLPLDVLALLALAITLTVWGGKEIWAQMQVMWVNSIGQEKKWQ